jgi:hypothetical protein
MSGEESRLSEMLEAGGTAVEIAVALNRRAFPLMRACKGFIESDRSAISPAVLDGGRNKQCPPGGAFARRPGTIRPRCLISSAA